MNIKKYTILLIISLLILVALGWTIYARGLAREEAGGLKVTATIYPFAYLATHIGGERISVDTIVPAGVEAHDFEPTAQDLARLSKSRLVLAAGSGLDTWIDNVRPEIEQAQGRVLVASEILSDLDASGDPHVWLDPVKMEALAQEIAKTLSELDPEGRLYYESRLSILLVNLASLDSAYRQGLSDCTQREFVTTHAAFAYLAKAYGLEQIAITGFDPSVEPGAGQLAELTEAVRAKNIKYIFFEEMVGPELSRTLAKEVGAAVLVLNSLESLPEEMQLSGQDYQSEMLNNLSNLRLALECR